MNKRPRADAILKTLSAELQAEIYARLTQRTAEWPDTSLNAVRAWLATKDIHVAHQLLSRFHVWYSANLDLQVSHDLVETFEKFAQERHPDWSPDRVREATVQFLMAHTAARRKVGQFVCIAKLDQQERFAKTQSALDERKLKVNEKKLVLLQRKAEQAERAAQVTASNLSPAEKNAAYRTIFGMET